MVGLKSDGRHQDVFRIFLPQVIAEEHEYGTDAFAAQVENVFHGVVERLGLALVLLTGQEVVDFLQNDIG